MEQGGKEDETAGITEHAGSGLERVGKPVRRCEKDIYLVIPQQTSKIRSSG
jgi:hypothetical protein